MFNRKLKEHMDYLDLKLRKVERLEKYIITTNERIDELEKEIKNNK
jgi:hypothetical protein